jgi:hypothetical protein
MQPRVTSRRTGRDLCGGTSARAIAGRWQMEDPKDGAAEEADGRESANEAPSEKKDEVQEQLEESFPASDPPSY